MGALIVDKGVLDAALILIEVGIGILDMALEEAGILGEVWILAGVLNTVVGTLRVRIEVWIFESLILEASVVV